ncbi:MAG TPA: phosphonate ABC transporter ATP-binding protein [Spirochaetia bacterium]|nr:phosphonate ABC transporter ATP-binding protein [Spirochaetia bacterium]
MALLELKNVTKCYHGAARALSDVSFSVDEGEFVSIIGSSGSGKTTLLRCINRMIEPSDGQISFAGVSVSGLRKRDLRRVRTKIGMIFQHHNLVERLSVIENVLHGRLGYKSTLAGMLGVYTQEEKRKAFEILEVLGLDQHVYQRCDQLSGGQKQRVGIARALVQNPQMILCDEPIASLDPGTSKIIMDYLSDICRDWGITLVISLHQVETALRYSHRIIAFSKGTIQYNGAPAGLTRERISAIYGAEPMLARQAG